MEYASIVRVPILPLHMVNAFVVFGGRGCILVDTGLPGSAPRFERVLRERGCRWSDVRLIVVTHAHVDHAGSAAELRRLTGAPIVAHAGDLAHYRGDQPLTFCPTGWFGSLFLRTGAPGERYEAFVPEILLQAGEALDLTPYGVVGEVRDTVGHTAGSISVVLEAGHALVSDLLASGLLLGGIAFRGRPKRPPYEDDPGAVARQLRALLDGGVHTFHLGHGGPLASPAVRSHARLLESCRHLGGEGGWA